MDDVRTAMSLIWQSRLEDEEVRAVFVMDDLFLVRFTRIAVPSADEPPEYHEEWVEQGRSIVTSDHFKELGMKRWDQQVASTPAPNCQSCGHPKHLHYRDGERGGACAGGSMAAMCRCSAELR